MCARSERAENFEVAKTAKAEAFDSSNFRKSKKQSAENLLRVYTLSGKIIELNEIEYLVSSG